MSAYSEHQGSTSQKEEAKQLESRARAQTCHLKARVPEFKFGYVLQDPSARKPH